MFNNIVEYSLFLLFFARCCEKLPGTKLTAITTTQGPREALQIGGGGHKGVFREKFHKKSVKSRENLLFQLEKIETF
jgi:hypothetical protein